MLTAGQIIDALGGTTALARALSNSGRKVGTSTVQSWKTSGSIPAWRHEAIAQHAASIGVKLSVEEIPTRREPAGADS